MSALQMKGRWMSSTCVCKPDNLQKIRYNNAQVVNVVCRAAVLRLLSRLATPSKEIKSMKIRVIAGVLLTTVFAIGAEKGSAQDGKALDNDKGSKSAPVYNPKNGHYYEFVGEKELTWPQAKQRRSRLLLLGIRYRTCMNSSVG